MKKYEASAFIKTGTVLRYLIDARDIGLPDVRKTSQEHLRTQLIPAAILIMNQDQGHGKLTAELAKQINDNAREIRKGVLERAKAISLYDEYGVEGWPKEFKSELLWPIPWWIILSFVSWFAAGVFIGQSPLYDQVERLFVAEKSAPADPSTGGPPAGKTAVEPSPGQSLPGDRDSGMADPAAAGKTPPENPGSAGTKVPTQ